MWRGLKNPNDHAEPTKVERYKKAKKRAKYLHIVQEEMGYRELFMYCFQVKGHIYDKNSLAF